MFHAIGHAGDHAKSADSQRKPIGTFKPLRPKMSGDARHVDGSCEIAFLGLRDTPPVYPGSTSNVHVVA